MVKNTWFYHIYTSFSVKEDALCGSVLMKHNKMLMVRSADDIRNEKDTSRI